MNTAPENSDDPKKSPFGLLKKLFYLGLVLFITLSFLPKIVSSSWVSSLIFARVNAHSTVQVSAEKVALTWNKGFMIEQMTVELDDQNRVEIAQVLGSSGLISILRKHDVGDVLVDGLQVYWTQPEVPQKGKARAGAVTSQAPESVVSTYPEVARAKGLTWPDLRGVVRIQNGQFSVLDRRGGAQTVLGPIEGRLDFLDGAALGSLSLVAPFHERKGKLVLLGDIKKSMAGVKTIEQLPLTLHITLRDVDLAQHNDWIVGLGGLEHVEGEVNVGFHVEGVVESGLDVKGSILASDLGVDAAVLGEDSLILEAFQFDGEGRVLQKAFVLKNVSINSDIGTLFAKPERVDAEQKLYVLESKIDLAKVASMLPNTLGLREEMLVEQGMASIDGAITTGADARVEGVIRIEHLAGQAGEQELRLKEPVSLQADVALNKGAFAVEKLSLESSFLSADGKGDLDDFALGGQLNLAGAFEELGQFLDLKGFEAAGDVNLRLGITANDGGEGYTTEGALNFSQVKVSASKAQTSSPWDGSLRLRGTMRPGDEAWVFSEQVFVHSPWGEGRLSFSDAQLSAEDGFGIHGWEAKGRIALGAWMPKALQQLLSSNGVVHAQGTLATNTLRVKQARLEVPPLAEEDQGVTLQLAGAVDFLEKGFQLSQLQLNAPGLQVANDGMVSAHSGRLELSSDMALLQDWFNPEAKLEVAGGLHGHLALQSTGALHADLDIRDCRITEEQTQRLMISSGSLLVEAANEADQVTISKLSIDSPGLQLESVGAVSRGEDAVLHLEGDLGYDLAKVVEGFPLLQEEGVVAKGQSNRPFLLHLPFSGSEDEKFKALKASLSFMASQIQAYGLRFSDLEIPVSADAGTLQASIQGGVELGTINFVPTITYDQLGPVLMVNTGVEVISKIQLTPELADRVFGRIHPVFKGSTVVEGKVSLLFNEFELPLEEAHMAEGGFSGMMYFRGVKVSVEGLLEEVLKLAELDSSELEVGDRDVKFVCRDGYIETDPFEVKVKGETLRLHGKMYLSGALDYVAEVPLTESLVGKEVAEAAGDQVLKIPIGGTASHPKVDRDAVKNSLRALTRDAGKDLLKEKASEYLGGDAQKVIDKLFR